MAALRPSSDDLGTLLITSSTMIQTHTTVGCCSYKELRCSGQVKPALLWLGGGGKQSCVTCSFHQPTRSLLLTSTRGLATGHTWPDDMLCLASTRRKTAGLRLYETRA